MNNLILNNFFRIKRGLQQESLKLTKSTNKRLWETATFCIFDVPDQLSKTYEERIDFLKNFSKNSQWPSYLHVVDTILCKDREHLRNFMKEVLSKRGEGVMLRKYNSFYEYGRSNSMKRYKEFQDSEVKIIKNMYPHGLECEQ